MLAFLRWVRSAKLDWFGKMICADELGSFGQVRRGRATHDRAINGSPAIRLRDAACAEIIRFSGFVLRGRFGALSLGPGNRRSAADHLLAGDIDIIGISALGSFGQFGGSLASYQTPRSGFISGAQGGDRSGV